jgi:ubiquinone/menaquinone biosynthesis C-methylase UbiE
MFTSENTIFTPQKRINPYDSKPMADCYDRPSSLYQMMVQQFKAQISLEKPVKKALDIGCGTGISSQALKVISEDIVGVDPAIDMLKQAKSDPRIHYKKGYAEKIPCEAESFDLVAACVAFHFFDKAAFFKEAARVLKDSGHLLIGYTNFTGLKTEAFNTWRKDVFYKTYPPTKAKRNAIDESLLSDDFPSITENTISTSVEVDIESLAALMMTMSGPGEALQKPSIKPSEIKQWLLKELDPFFSESKTVSFYWDIKTWNLQRAPRPVNEALPVSTLDAGATLKL